MREFQLKLKNSEQNNCLVWQNVYFSVPPHKIHKWHLIPDAMVSGSGAIGMFCLHEWNWWSYKMHTREYPHTFSLCEDTAK